MRKFFRFIAIVVIGISLTIFAFSKSVVDVVFDENTVKKEIEAAGIYEGLNNELKTSLKQELKEEIDEDPELKDKFDEMIESVFTEDVLKNEIDDILEQAYSNSTTVEFDANILIDGYTRNLENYLKENNIELPQEVKAEIEEWKKENSSEKTNIIEKDEDINNLYDIKELVNTAIKGILIGIIVFWVIAILLSKEKLKIIYKPLILSGTFLILIRVGITSFVNELAASAREEFITDVGDGVEYVGNFIDTMKNTVFANIDKFAIGFLAIGIGILVVKIVMNKRKQETINLNEDNENELL